jgi:hypothetical protein
MFSGNLSLGLSGSGRARSRVDVVLWVAGRVVGWVVACGSPHAKPAAMHAPANQPNANPARGPL